MLDGSSPEKPKDKPKPKPFSTKAALGSPTKFAVATKLPTERHIDDLWKLGPLGNEIANYLRIFHAELTDRGEPKSGDQLTMHVAVSGLKETHTGKKFKNKDHALKASIAITGAQNILAKIETALASKATLKEQRPVLTNYQALFMGHLAVLKVNADTMPQQKKEHVKTYHNLDVDKLDPTPLSPAKKVLIQQMLPQSPSPRKSLAEKRTPVKVDAPTRKSIAALQAEVPPSPSKVYSPFKPRAASPKAVIGPMPRGKDGSPKVIHGELQPRSVLLKSKRATLTKDPGELKSASLLREIMDAKPAKAGKDTAPMPLSASLRFSKPAALPPYLKEEEDLGVPIDRPHEGPGF
jgi:hypothetical protein